MNNEKNIATNPVLVAGVQGVAVPNIIPMIGLSGGINSMAVLCWLIEQENKPKEVHLFYAHFAEHSPDTFQFVADGIRYARKHFDKVHVKITSNNVLDYFRKNKMIPHPALSPCSRQLKIEVASAYAFQNDIKVDMIGYVKHELKRRLSKQKAKSQDALWQLEKQYPIGAFTDEWCFEIVMKHIGWYPAIYDLKWTEEDFNEGLCDKEDIGKRIFKHNNCLPCKNMDTKDMGAVKKYFPEKHNKAIELSAELGKHWGRDKAEFYTMFGRDLGQDSTCKDCVW